MSEKLELTDQLWKLDAKQARQILADFLVAGKSKISSLEIPVIVINYSIFSVIQLMKHVVSEIKNGTINTDEINYWFAVLGYYFGDALCREKPGLFWDIGNPDFAFVNHPVVRGFAKSEEAPVVTISKNMVTAVAAGESPASRIERGVNNWYNKSVMAHPTEP